MNTTCDNCHHQWPEDQLNPIKDLKQRVAPGEVMPAGECPGCGALCHIAIPPKSIIVNVHGGLVQDVFSDASDIDLVVVDWDTEGVNEEDMERDEWLTTIGGSVVRAYPATIHRLHTMSEELQAALNFVNECSNET